MPFTLQGSKQTLSIKQPKCNGITHFTYLHGTSVRTLYSVITLLSKGRELIILTSHTRKFLREQAHCPWCTTVSLGMDLRGCCPILPSRCQTYFHGKQCTYLCLPGPDPRGRQIPVLTVLSVMYLQLESKEGRGTV